MDPPLDSPAPASSAPREKRPHTILGRLAQAVREQNWFAVVLELAIVVLGVVVGFQVTGWGQARADRAQEQTYLRQLVVDLTQTERSFVDQAPTWNRQDASAGKLLRAFRSDSLPPADSVLRWASLAIDFKRPTVVTATATALVETGDLNLIRNDSLRSSITNYLDLMDQSRSERAHIDEEARPFILSMTERVDFIDGWFGAEAMRPGQRDSMASGWPMSPVPAGPVRTVRALDVEALVRDPAAYTTASNLWRLRAAMMINRGSALGETVALREQVEAELNR